MCGVMDHDLAIFDMIWPQGAVESEASGVTGAGAGRVRSGDLFLEMVPVPTVTVPQSA